MSKMFENIVIFEYWRVSTLRFKSKEVKFFEYYSSGFKNYLAVDIIILIFSTITTKFFNIEINLKTNIALFLAACANSSMGFLEDEIDRLKDENRSQHEQILALQAQLQDTEDKMRRVGSLMPY